MRFRNSDGCSSWVGRQGGRQDINLPVGCGTGAVVHEILHALGFHHEHVRHDRDHHVQILWDNIQNSKRHNFRKDDLACDIGTYDYPSIMHYHGYAFCKRDASNACVGPTILTTPAGTPIGSSVLSPLDIRAINLLYPGEPPTLSITSPSPGATFPHRDIPITFGADVHDPEDMTVEVTRSSDVEGVLRHRQPPYGVLRDHVLRRAHGQRTRRGPTREHRAARHPRLHRRPGHGANWRTEQPALGGHPRYRPEPRTRRG